MNLRSVSEVEAARADLLDQIAELDAIETEIRARTPAQRIADLIHDRVCAQNHTDGCGYYYDSWDKAFGPLSARSLFLRRAEALLAVLTNDGSDFASEADERFAERVVEAITRGGY